MNELTLEEKIEKEFQSKLKSIDLEYVNWRYLTEEYCQSVVGKEIQIEDELFKVNSIVDRNALDEDGFKKEEGAIKFYLEDASGKEFQYFLNPETNGNTEYQISASLGILKAIYQENKMDVLSKFDDEDADMYFNYKVNEYIRDISQYIDKLPNEKEKQDSDKELEILHSNLKDAVEKIDVFKTPRVIALDILREPYENLEILKTKLYNHLITQNINPMENQDNKMATTFSFTKTKRSFVVSFENQFKIYSHSWEEKSVEMSKPTHSDFTIEADNLDSAIAQAKVNYAAIREEKIAYQAKRLAAMDPFWLDVASRVGMDVCTPFMKRFPGHSFIAYDNDTVWSKSLKVLFVTKAGVTVSINNPLARKGEVVGFGSDLNNFLNEQKQSNFQKRIDFAKSWELKEKLPWSANDLIAYLHKGLTEKERASFAQKLPTELQTTFNAKNPFLIKVAELEKYASYLNSDASFLTKKEAIQHIDEKPNRVAHNHFVQDNNNQVWSEINKIDIIDYACAHLRCKINNKRSTKKTTVLDVPNSNEKLLVTKYDGGKYGIANDSFSFKGNNIAFIAAYSFNEHGSLSKPTLQKLVNHLKQTGYIEDNKMVIREPKYQYNEASAKKNKEDKGKAKSVKHFVNLKYSALLHDRGILPSTVNAPCFRGLIENSYVEHKPEYRNIAFKFRDRDNKIFTYFEKNQTFEKFQANQSTEGLLFLSHAPKLGIEKIVIAETPIDLMSYAQMNGIDNEKTLYIATGGNINDGQLNVIAAIVQNNIETEAPVKIHLATDHDRAGLMYDFKITQALQSSLINNIDNDHHKNELQSQIDTRNEQFFEIYNDKSLSSTDKHNQLSELVNNVLTQPVVQNNSLDIILSKSPIGKDWNEALVASYDNVYSSQRLLNTNTLPEFKDFLAAEKAGGAEVIFQKLNELKLSPSNTQILKP